MQNPKLFISYCWSSPDHEEWVLRLGTELIENGVDVVLDKWDLKEGNDANAFMEQMVSDEDIKKVIIVIDEQYSEKANQRKGGVGTETQIISAEVYESVNQNKFVAVIAHRNEEGKAKLPTFYKSRIYIDLSDEELYGKNFEQLLRWIYDKPLNIKPSLGKKPSFLEEAFQESLGTSTAFRRLTDAVKSNRPYSHGALTEYFNIFSENLKRFRLEPSKGVQDFDDRIVESIQRSIPVRNELIEVFGTIAQYDQSTNTATAIHNFFESLIHYLYPPHGVNSYHKWDFDNLKFIIHESFITCIAVLLKHERFDIAARILSQRYYEERDDYSGNSKMVSFGKFMEHLASLEHRNNRLNLRRHSVHADMIKERCSNSGISFNHIMQADFVLYLADSLSCLKEGTYRSWHPTTLVFKSFHSGSFEIFLKAESQEYFSRLAPVIGIKSKSELSPLIDAIRGGSIRTPRWGHDDIDPPTLMNYERLCTRA